MGSQEPNVQHPQRRWRPRPVASAILRVLVFATPLALAVLAALGTAAMLPRPGGAWMVGWWALVLGVSYATLVVVDSLARRLLPLAALLELTMLFPDQAPSRFRIARRQAGGAQALRRQLEEARDAGRDDASETAATVLALVTALGSHDKRTRGHSERVHIFADALAEEMGLDQDSRDRLRWAALLHDIGKLGVPAEVLNKPGRPDEDEWEQLRRHPEEGANLIEPLMGFLGPWASAVSQHHERWDGKGYPAGLAGAQIGLSARIVAVADAFEVMTAPRTYKRPIGAEAARRELAACAGTQFDPAVVRALLALSIGKLRRLIGPLGFLAPVPFVARVASASPTAVKVGTAAGVGAALTLGGLAGPDWTAPRSSADAAEAPVVLESTAETAPTLSEVTSSGASSASASDPEPAQVAAEEGAGAAPADATPPERNRISVETYVLSRRGTLAQPGGAGDPDAVEPAPGGAGDTTAGATGGGPASDATAGSGDRAAGTGQTHGTTAGVDPGGDRRDRDAPAGPAPAGADGTSPAGDDEGDAASGRQAARGVDDHAETTAGTTISIDVLANDGYLRDGARVRVIVAPDHGVARVEGQQQVAYTPGDGFTGTDRFRYQVCNPGGGCGTAWVTVEVR